MRQGGRGRGEERGEEREGREGRKGGRGKETEGREGWEGKGRGEERKRREGDERRKASYSRYSLCPTFPLPVAATSSFLVLNRSRTRTVESCCRSNEARPWA